MKKILYSWWLKLAAALLAFVCILVGVVSVCCMGVRFTENSKEEVIEYAWREIFDHRAYYLMDQYMNRGASLDLLEDSNLSYAVIASSLNDLNNVDLSDKSVYIYRSPDFDSDYKIHIFGGKQKEEESYNVYHYVEDSLIGMIVQGVHREGMDWGENYVYDFVVDSSTGVIYADIEEGYYPIEQIRVKSELVSLTKSQEGVYYAYEDGRTLSGDYYLDSEVTVEVGEEEYSVVFQTEDGTFPEKTEDGEQDLKGKIYVNSIDSFEIKNNLLIPDENYTDKRYLQNASSNQFYLKDSKQETYYWVLGNVRGDLPESDMFSKAYGLINLIWNIGRHGTMLFGIFLLFLITTAGYLACAAGHRPDREGIVLSWYDKVPYGILLVSVCCLEMAVWVPGVLFIAECIGFVFPDEFFCLLLLLLLLVAYAAVLLFIYSTIVRLKARKFWRYTLAYLIYKPIRFLMHKLRTGLSSMVRNLPIVAVIAALFMAISIAESFTITTGIYYYSDICIIFYILIKWAELVLLIWIALQMMRLREGGKRIAAGDLSTPINTKGLVWEFKAHGDNINKVGDGIALAVEERMKSEHFRTELITNVSHDIKTPLTSIINYVDLIKKQDLTDPTMVEYISVLDRQSARLKKLIEDLMEASKASTGNLEVNLEKCDVSVLFEQMIGEFEERAAEQDLSFVVNVPKSQVYIMADGRHLWRIFDNLLNNICKYAMPGTRVYVELIPQRGEAVITFKNISRHQLNISSEELLERFVRGDSSRNTEGSGLGLSIAQSLTELLQGHMELAVDGDLFKVILRFPIVEEQEAR